MSEETTQVQELAREAPKSEQPHDDTLLMSVLAYIGILVVIPIIVAKNNPTVKFHVRQGLVLAIIEVLVFATESVLWIGMLSPIFTIINLGCIVLSIIGIINVTQKKQKELPLIGAYARYITF